MPWWIKINQFRLLSISKLFLQESKIEYDLVLRLIRFKMERCFSAMNVVKKKLRNKIGDQFMSHSLIFYSERANMFIGDRSKRGTLKCEWLYMIILFYVTYFKLVELIFHFSMFLEGWESAHEAIMLLWYYSISKQVIFTILSSRYVLLSLVLM